MKYGNRKVCIDGIQFDSKLEASRWLFLSGQQKQGTISDLRRQVKFVLIPAQYEPNTVGRRGGVRKGKLLERECSYIADFVYTDSGGQTVVEDTKGVKTPDYVIKRKLMLYLHGIRVKEVRSR